MTTTIKNVSEIEISYKTKIKKSELISITSSNIACDVLKSIWSDKIDNIKEVIILCLNKANKVLGWYKISSGGLDSSVIDVRVICQIALNTNSTGIILSHNHPSGNLNPSKEDLEITKKVKTALSTLDIQLFDHVIVTDEKYYSFADDGIL